MSKLTIAALFLAVATALAFLPLWNNGFVNLDDEAYLTRNPIVKRGLTADGARWAFTTLTLFNWHPLTWLAHMTDVALFGMRAEWHHAMSLIIHIFNSLILLILLNRLTGALSPAIFVSALFALHPLHVESVAWISERKDVLSTLFWFLSIFYYHRFLRARGFSAYIVSLILFIAGLMAKPMLVTLPGTLLLLDFWPLGRLSFRGFRAWRDKMPIITEKIPFILVAAASSTITFMAQKQGYAVHSLGEISFLERVESALSAYCGYLIKTAWPLHLSVLYPLHRGSRPLWATAGAAVILGLVSVAAWKLRRERPWAITGWFWFMGTLVPVIGLIQVGEQAMADRYTYVPLIGLFLALAWCGKDAARRMKIRSALVIICCLIVIAAAVLTWRQTQVWRDSESLFISGIKNTKRNSILETNLGAALGDLGRHEEALRHFLKAIEYDPENPEAQANVALALVRQGRAEDAAPHFLKAAKYKADVGLAAFYKGQAHEAEGNLSAAADAYGQAVVKRPDDIDIRLSFGIALQRLGRNEEAIIQYRRILAADPEQSTALFNLGATLESAGLVDQAAEVYRRLIGLYPNDDEARWRLSRLEQANKR